MRFTPLNVYRAGVKLGGTASGPGFWVGTGGTSEGCVTIPVPPLPPPTPAVSSPTAAS